MKRSHLQIALYMLTVFVSGVVVGAFAHQLYMVKTVTADPPRPRNPEEFRKKYVDDMRTRLSLSDEQAAKLNGILDQTGSRFRTFRETHKAETDAIHEQQVRDINAMLNDSQRASYAAYREEREKKRREGEGKR